nr:MAG TPA: hypothetical protein [Bacteriophage sp.]
MLIRIISYYKFKFKGMLLSIPISWEYIISNINNSCLSVFPEISSKELHIIFWYYCNS